MSLFRILKPKFPAWVSLIWTKRVLAKPTLRSCLKPKIFLRGREKDQIKVGEKFYSPYYLEEMLYEDAKKCGATGNFENKYGTTVKVYTIAEISKEICGGPHVAHTGELGHFKISKEESSSSGIRRIKAILE
ncbi:MAG: Alanine-tRNA ligase [Parcubacteria group bacterium GW2011_GWE2_40_8]|nr:MAG: Alanine-tRNA ligase [Parcubacteria group bacterium GW2011_GWE2_40_8]